MWGAIIMVTDRNSQQKFMFLVIYTKNAKLVMHILPRLKPSSQRVLRKPSIFKPLTASPPWRIAWSPIQVFGMLRYGVTGRAWWAQYKYWRTGKSVCQTNIVIYIGSQIKKLLCNRIIKEIKIYNFYVYIFKYFYIRWFRAVWLVIQIGRNWKLSNQTAGKIIANLMTIRFRFGKLFVNLEMGN